MYGALLDETDVAVGLTSAPLNRSQLDRQAYDWELTPAG